MYEQQMIEEILEKEYGTHPADILCIYPYGSAVYGTLTDKSDRDYVVIADTDKCFRQYESDEVDIHFFAHDHFQEMLDKQHILALETHFNQNPIMKKWEATFTLDLVKLRHHISSRVSNSWVKAKKKVKLEGENNWIGYKSLFHSLRMLDYGIQVAETGMISDFQGPSRFWNEIIERVNRGEDFESIMKHFKPILNTNQTAFRVLAPKE